MAKKRNGARQSKSVASPAPISTPRPTPMDRAAAWNEYTRGRTGIG